MNKNNNFEIATYKVKSFKDVNDVHYNGNLDEYFRAVEIGRASCRERV